MDGSNRLKQFMIEMPLNILKNLSLDQAFNHNSRLLTTSLSLVCNQDTPLILGKLGMCKPRKANISAKSSRQSVEWVTLCLNKDDNSNNQLNFGGKSFKKRCHNVPPRVVL